MPYRVSPRVVDHSTGPKPTKKSLTRIPARLAVMKWPNSWPITMTRTRKITSGSAQPHSQVSAATTATAPATSAATEEVEDGGFGDVGSALTRAG